MKTTEQMQDTIREQVAHISSLGYGFGKSAALQEFNEMLETFRRGCEQEVLQKCLDTEGDKLHILMLMIKERTK